MDPEIVRRSFVVHVRAVNEEGRSVDVVASTDALDSYDEIVDQSWDLKRYNANPVVLYNHNREGFLETLDPEDTLPIGYGRDVAVKNGQLEATLCFVTAEASAMAELVWQGFRQGSLRAVSVGFNPRTVTAEKLNDKTVYRLSDNELFEISVTPMGANPEAVMKARRKSIEQLRRLADNAKAPMETTTMDLNEKIAALEVEKAQLTAAVAQQKKDAEVAAVATSALRAELGIANDRVKAVETERNDATAKLTALSTQLADASAKLVEQEVDALVGLKIDPAQKSAFLELAKADHGRFKAIVDVMPTKSTLAKVVPTDPNPNSNDAAVSSNGQDLASAINAKAATL